MTSDDIIRAIYECVPAGSCEPNDCGTVSRLRALTADLLRDYETSGFLERHPFSEASSRCLHGEHLRVEGQLANKTVLVRGGEGTVGRYLISTFHRDVYKFTEKPDVKAARRFVASGEYFWNAGIFVWRAGSFVRALRQHAPELAAATGDVVRLHRAHGVIDADAWARVPRISIDYALCEPAAASGQMRMVPASFAWWDLGTWASVAGFDAGLMDRESQDQDRVARVRSEDCFVHQLPGSDRRVALLGVADLVVVDAGDALLIAHKDSVADTKDLVAFLGSLGWSDVL